MKPLAAPGRSRTWSPPQDKAEEMPWTMPGWVGWLRKWKELCSLLKHPNLKDAFPPVVALFSRDLLVPELKIKACRLIDTLWLLSMRLRHEVIKNNSSCHYPNNSVGLSDCNPIWPFVIPSAAIVRLQFHHLWRANSPPNKGQTRARALWTSLGEQGGVAMPKFSLSWGSPKITALLGRACHRGWLRTFLIHLE